MKASEPMNEIRQRQQRQQKQQQKQRQQQQHQQQFHHHHGVGISAPSNGYGTGATYSNFEGTSFQRKREISVFQDDIYVSC